MWFIIHSHWNTWTVTFIFNADRWDWHCLNMIVYEVDYHVSESCIWTKSFIWCPVNRRQRAKSVSAFAGVWTFISLCIIFGYTLRSQFQWKSNFHNHQNLSCTLRPCFFRSLDGIYAHGVSIDHFHVLLPTESQLLSSWPLERLPPGFGSEDMSIVRNNILSLWDECPPRSTRVEPTR